MIAGRKKNNIDFLFSACYVYCCQTAVRHAEKRKPLLLHVATRRARVVAVFGSGRKIPRKYVVPEPSRNFGIETLLTRAVSVVPSIRLHLAAAFEMQMGVRETVLDSRQTRQASDAAFTLYWIAPLFFLTACLAFAHSEKRNAQPPC